MEVDRFAVVVVVEVWKVVHEAEEKKLAASSRTVQLVVEEVWTAGSGRCS